jgi:hypothetical protein
MRTTALENCSIFVLGGDGVNMITDYSECGFTAVPHPQQAGAVSFQILSNLQFIINFPISFDLQNLRHFTAWLNSNVIVNHKSSDFNINCRNHCAEDSDLLLKPVSTVRLLVLPVLNAYLFLNVPNMKNIGSCFQARVRNKKLQQAPITFVAVCLSQCGNSLLLDRFP